jgi:hypothetical protein
MLAAMHHTERLGLGFDEVDALTGPAIGRPKSATYRTADVVGIDTLLHVVKTMTDNLRPTRGTATSRRPPGWPRWSSKRPRPEDESRRLSQGRQGRSGCSTSRRRITATPPAIADEVQAMLAERDPQMKLAALRASAHPQAQFLCGRSSATCSITSPCIWATLRTTRATSISPCAVASAGRPVRSKPGRAPAGSMSPNGCAKTSPPAAR